MTTDATEILLVEDDPDDERLTLYAFGKHRLTNHVHVARDGAAALEYLFGNELEPDADRQMLPRVVLLDLKLPKVGGLEVLERIKVDPRTRSIPVVVLTSSKENADLRRAYELGANSYIVKPVDFEQFTEAVRLLGFYWALLNQPSPGSSGG